ncbi:hypothetical protein [Saccharopolyspora gregorii]|uniref:Enolase C-terminal domain-containing protein n=1 Tax=Saccharopolyspora gregorii TaxID=33914 RepID=A0ABP6RN55_9PSEU
MLPRAMNAVHRTGHGGVEVLEHRTDVPMPPARPGEALIRVAAAGVLPGTAPGLGVEVDRDVLGAPIATWGG